jgi:flagellar biosynthesis protein FlhF
MNVRRFVGKNAREAMAQVRATWGDQAAVLSNRPIPGGVEILAMAGTDVPAEPAPARGNAPMARAAELPSHRVAEAPQRPPLSQRAAAQLPQPGAAAASPAAAARPVRKPAERVAPMSTLSFQEFVRERQKADTMPAPQAEALFMSEAAPVQAVPRQAPVEPGRFAAQQLREELLREELAREEEEAMHAAFAAPAYGAPVSRVAPVAAPVSAATPRLGEAAREFATIERAGDGDDVMAELKSMRGLIASQLASLSWFDSVRRSPGQTALLRLMMGNGFSPQLARQAVSRLPEGKTESQAAGWLLELLSHNLRCANAQDSIVEQGGVFALVGPTGVGKTTTTAKLAANFAMRHGAASVGLITVDTYRMAASDQLRAFGKILNIPVHTARDGASLADLLGLFDRKKLVLIDTVGVGQRDKRLTELFSALPAGRVQRLLVLNAAAQAETLEEVVQAYGAGAGTRCVISKLDEAVKCGGVVDVALRHRLTVEGIANGQRVPEDWHAARPQLLVQKALMKQAQGAFMPDDDELGLLLTTPPSMNRAAPEGQRA